ncbi:MAG: SURF1 family protein [Parvibaculales bacterium]
MKPKLFIFFSLAVIVLLVGLGNWQWQRRGEKLEMIDHVSLAERGGEIEISSPLSFAHVSEREQYHGVRLVGRFGEGVEYFYVLEGKQGGFREILPFLLEGGGVVLVMGRFFALGEVLPRRSSFGLASGRIYFPQGQSPFTPGNEAGRHIWYRSDIVAMAGNMGVSEIVAPFFVVTHLDTPPLPAVSPARHLSYALSWYGLALALLACLFTWGLRQRKS